MVEVQEYLDENSKCDDYRGFRQKIKRSQTNCPSLFVFINCVIVWICIAIFAFNNTMSRIPEHFWEYVSTQINHQIHQNVVQKAFKDARNVILSFGWLSIGFLLLYFFMMYRFTNFMIKLTLVITIGLFIVPVTIGTKGELIIWAILILLYLLTLYALKKVGTQLVSEIVKDSIKVMTNLPIAFLYLICISVLITVIFAVTLVAVFYLAMINHQELVRKLDVDSREHLIKQEYIPTYVYILIATFLLCSFWIVIFVDHFGRMTLYGIFSRWYRTSNKKSVSNLDVILHLAIALRYHAGTMAFGSTIFTKVEMLKILYRSRTRVITEIRKRPIILPYLLVIMGNSTTNALVACTIHGKNFSESMKNAFILFLDCPLKYVAVRLMTLFMMILGLFIVPLLSFMLPCLWFSMNENEYDIPARLVTILIITSFSVPLTGISMCLFDIAIDTMTFCYFDKLKTKEVESSLIEINQE